MFMTIEELREWTGYKRAGDVMRWLDANHYRYDVAADGWPRVLKSVVIAKLGGEVKREEPRLNFA